MDQRRVLYAINLCIDFACLMDLAKAFKILQLSCAGAKENGKEEQVLPALFGNFNLDPSRFTYSDWKKSAATHPLFCKI